MNFKFYGVTAWPSNSRNTHWRISIYLYIYNTIKFGQLIEGNMKNIFLGKSYTNCGVETSPRPFSEKLKFSISLDQ